MECWLCTGAFLGPSRGFPPLILLAIVTDPLAGLSRVSPCGTACGREGEEWVEFRKGSHRRLELQERPWGRGACYTCALRLWSWWHLHGGALPPPLRPAEPVLPSLASSQPCLWVLHYGTGTARRGQ